MAISPQHASQAVTHGGLREFVPCSHRTELVLQVYRTPSGQMAGRLLQGRHELAKIDGAAGCETSFEVERLIAKLGFEADTVVDLDASRLAKLERACGAVSDDIEQIGMVTVETVDLVRDALNPVNAA